jgi:hypothetical protein
MTTYAIKLRDDGKWCFARDGARQPIRAYGPKFRDQCIAYAVGYLGRHGGKCAVFNEDGLALQTITPNEVLQFS